VASEIALTTAGRAQPAQRPDGVGDRQPGGDPADRGEHELAQRRRGGEAVALAAATATVRMVSAVASLSSPSPWMRVISRGGRPTRRPTASAATGSGGATAAPSAMPAASVAPGRTASKPTPMSTAVTSTSSTDRLTTVRRLRRMASSEESSAAL
jgi:hypothetical protein